MNLREAAQSALDALENWDALIKHQYSGSREAMSDLSMAAWDTPPVITALRAALAEDAMQRLTDVQQEMDCYGDGNVYRGQRSSDSQTPTLTINGLAKKTSVRGTLLEVNVRNAFDRIYSDHIPDATKMEATCQQSRQVEPVAWRFYDGKIWCYVNHISDLSASTKFEPLYPAPPKRKPLTKEQLLYVYNQLPNCVGLKTPITARQLTSRLVST